MEKLQKTLILFISFVTIAGFANAQTVHVVNNNILAPDGENVYGTLQDAVDAASDGDIIHVVPGLTGGYGDVTIAKEISLFGIGFNPDKELEGISVVGNIRIEGGEFEATSGVLIEGLSISAIRLDDDLNNLTIKNNLISGQLYFTNESNISGLEISNNIFYNTTPQINFHPSSEIQNIEIQNNIFTRSTQAIRQAHSFVLIQNNLFLADGDRNALFGLSDCIIANNIFFGMRPRGTDLERNVFTNNLTMGNDDNSFPIGDGTNTGSGNLEGVNPQFINLSLTTSVWNFDWDPGLQEGSPAISAGSDDTDIGIFGGPSPFNTLYTGGSPIPIIQSLNLPGIIQPGQDLQINVKARGY